MSCEIIYKNLGSGPWTVSWDALFNQTKVKGEKYWQQFELVSNYEYL